MDTNLNSENVEIRKVHIAHLGDFGYGPGGHMTRTEWRAECMKYFLKGKHLFNKWQEELFLKESLNDNFSVPFGYTFDIEESSSIPISHRCSLDLVGEIFQSINADGYNFLHDVVFDAVIVIDSAGFNNVKFNGLARFGCSEFFGSARFGDTLFYSAARFEDVKFHRNASFYRASFEGECSFKNATFKSANFENVKFESVGHFEEARFIISTPTFRGCKIDSTRLEFSDDSYFPRYEISDEAIKNISFLKRLADEHWQTDQALNFNAMELRAKRLQAKSRWAYSFITWLYEILSNYGRSFAKPIFWYGILICLSALFAMIYSTYSDSPPEEQQVLCKPIKDQPPPLKLPYGRAVVEYAMFRAGGLMDFTDTGKQNNAVNCRLFEEPIEPPLMRAWGIFKGIASIALLFLAALGLRNKYRIK